MRLSVSVMKHIHVCVCFNVLGHMKSVHLFPSLCCLVKSSEQSVNWGVNFTSCKVFSWLRSKVCVEEV
uniref:Uncharacterized protein n=1 Tax=Arundo donax TaxID=35708 RepID=A0A0A9AX21_ARUDO